MKINIYIKILLKLTPLFLRFLNFINLLNDQDRNNRSLTTNVMKEYVVLKRLFLKQKKETANK